MRHAAGQFQTEMEHTPFRGVEPKDVASVAESDAEIEKGSSEVIEDIGSEENEVRMSARIKYVLTRNEQENDVMFRAMQTADLINNIDVSWGLRGILARC